MPSYRFNAPAHHTLEFSEDEIYHGGDVLELPEDSPVLATDPRLVPADAEPAPEEPAEAESAEQAEEPEAAE